MISLYHPGLYCAAQMPVLSGNKPLCEYMAISQIFTIITIINHNRDELSAKYFC